MQPMLHCGLATLEVEGKARNNPCVHLLSTFTLLSVCRLKQLSIVCSAAACLQVPPQYEELDDRFYTELELRVRGEGRAREGESKGEGGEAERGG